MLGRQTNTATAVIVDDHREWWEAVERSLAAVAVTVVGRCPSYEEGTRLVERLHPDLVVVETSMRHGETDGFEWLSTIRGRFPETKVIALSTSSKAAEIELALARGASVYVVKRTPQDDLAAAVRQLNSRSLYLAGTLAPVSSTSTADPAGLTGREQEILALTAEGLSNQLIARRLWVTEQ